MAADGDLDEIVGVVEVKDLLSVPPDRRAEITVADIMREPLFVPEQMPLPTVLERMRVHITEMAVVVDEYGGFAGIITDEDLAEELVGPIDDEHDAVSEPTVERLSERRYRIPGSLRLDEIEREIDVELPEGDYDTVAGLVLDRLDHFPEPGESIEVDGHHITVMEMDGRRITTVEIEVAESATRHDDDGRQAPDRGTPSAQDGEPMTTPLAITLSVVFLVANGFFVAAEFALLAARRSRIEQLASEGSRGAIAAQRRASRTVLDAGRSATRDHDRLAGSRGHRRAGVRSRSGAPVRGDRAPGGPRSSRRHS